MTSTCLHMEETPQAYTSSHPYRYELRVSALDVELANQYLAENSLLQKHKQIQTRAMKVQ